MNSFDFFRKYAIWASRSAVKRGVGSLPLRSASSMNALADSPVSTGDELIVIAIIYLFFSAQSYNITANYANIQK